MLVDSNKAAKICPLGWGLVVMDHGGIVPGVQQQPANVAPNCVEAKCALWITDSAACSLAVLGLESIHRTELLAEDMDERQKRTVELMRLAQEVIDLNRPREERSDATTLGTGGELDGDDDGGPSRN